MITCESRFSYCNVHEPGTMPDGKKKYSISILIPKTDTKGLNEINTAIQNAIKMGVDKGKFPKAAIPSLKLPLRDGDAEADVGKRGQEYKGNMFFNASSDRKPGIVDKYGKPFMDPEDEFYSGCWGHADINFYPFSAKGNKGIGAGLNHVLKKRDGERLDGRQSVDAAFADLVEDSGDSVPTTDELV